MKNINVEGALKLAAAARVAADKIMQPGVKVAMGTLQEEHDPTCMCALGHMLDAAGAHKNEKGFFALEDGTRIYGWSDFINMRLRTEEGYPAYVAGAVDVYEANDEGNIQGAAVALGLYARNLEAAAAKAG